MTSFGSYGTPFGTLLLVWGFPAEQRHNPSKIGRGKVRTVSGFLPCPAARILAQAEEPNHRPCVLLLTPARALAILAIAFKRTNFVYDLRYLAQTGPTLRHQKMVARFEQKSEVIL